MTSATCTRSRRRWRSSTATRSGRGANYSPSCRAADQAEERTVADQKAVHLEPTQEAGRALLARGIAGGVVMLNLLRFRPVADYSATPQLAPAEPISGAAAFRRYVEHTLPHLEQAGGELLFLGKGGHFLIGPSDERWDAVMLVRQRSVGALMAFPSTPDYLTGLGHRLAALEDSRLLPLVEGDLSATFPDGS